MKTNLILLTICALAVAGCTGTIYPEGDQFIFHSITLEGTTQNNCSVYVEEHADQDGLEDVAWTTEFLLDGKTETNSLPEDDGSQASHTLWVKATQIADGSVHYKKVVITLHE